MARSDAVPGTRTAGANNIGVLPGTGWHETNIVLAPDTTGIPRIDTVPGTTRELWTSSDAVPGAVPSDGFRRTFHVTQIIDVGEDEDDEDLLRKQFTLVQSRKRNVRTGQIAMTAGKQSIDESSDVGMHDVALSDSDSSADIDEGVAERPSTLKMPSACACTSNDPVFQLGKYKVTGISESHEAEPIILLMGDQAENHTASS